MKPAFHLRLNGFPSKESRRLLIVSFKAALSHRAPLKGTPQAASAFKADRRMHCKCPSISSGTRLIRLPPAPRSDTRLQRPCSEPCPIMRSSLSPHERQIFKEARCISDLQLVG